MLTKDARIATLEEQLRLAAVKSFAPKSERLSALAQMDLFNEAEHLSGASDGNEASAPEAAEIVVPAHARARGKRKPIDGNFPACVSSTTCRRSRRSAAAAASSRASARVQTSEQFDLIPARAQVLQHVRFKYACRSCEGTSHDGPAVITAAMPCATDFEVQRLDFPRKSGGLF